MNKNQSYIFRPLLTDFIDPDQGLAVFAGRYDWDYLEQAITSHYSHTIYRFALWLDSCCSNAIKTMTMKS